MQRVAAEGDRVSPSAQAEKRRHSGIRNSWVSWSRGGRQRRTPEEESKREEQLLAYMAWVNSQLKKRPGSRHLQSLPRDLQDGVALLQLIEVVAGKDLVMDENPSNYHAMRENVDRVLQFMSAQKIKMHHVSSKDIVEGNVKSVMRLILALAAHFKPGSVKPKQEPTVEADVQNRVTRRPSAAAAAAEAAAAIGEASRAAANVGRHLGAHYRNRTGIKGLLNHRRSPRVERTAQAAADPSGTPKIEQLPGDSGPSSRSTTVHSSIPERHRESKGQKQRLGSQTDSAPSSGNTTPRLQTSSGTQSPCHQHSLSDVESGFSRVSISDSFSLTQEFVNEMTNDYDSMEDDLLGTKEMLLELQEMLLEGRVPDDEVLEEECHLGASNIQEQLTIVTSRLSQRDADYDHLKSELNSYKQQCISLQGIKSGLTARLNQQDQAIMHFKTELLQHGFSQQQQHREAEELQKKLGERDREIKAMHAELVKREQANEQHRAELEEALQHIEEMKSSQASTRRTDDMQVYELQQKIQDLQEKLESVGITEADLSSRIACQDEKMGVLSQKILNFNQNNEEEDINRNQTLQRAEEMEVVREAIQNLRACFNASAHQQHTLDTLEQDFNGLDRHHREDGILDESVLRAMSDNPGVSTKVLYFTERTVTPFLTSIPKRLGEITLADFKKVFDRPGPYRYHFKALDPEFGTVKEEVVDDDGVVPGWEGKIVGWIEEDVGQKYLADDMA